MCTYTIVPAGNTTQQNLPNYANVTAYIRRHYMPSNLTVFDFCVVFFFFYGYVNVAYSFSFQ